MIKNASGESSGLVQAVEKLRAWIEGHRFAGYEPYDVLNSPFLRGGWAHRPPLSFVFLQTGKRFGGLHLREALKVPPSRNPKALGLCLSAYCDLSQSGYEVSEKAAWLKAELIRLRSAGEEEYCWGYDWDYMSIRGTRLPAFSPNSIASYFCGMAMLEMAEAFGDSEALEIAESVARFFVSRLNRSIESESAVCFSYTPNDRTLIYNSSALVGVFLARVGKLLGIAEYLSLARKAMVFLQRDQLETGGWYYGRRRRQKWIDGFHTSYNICALLDYQTITGSGEFEQTKLLGHRYYQSKFFTEEGAPKYFHNRVFPIDIHSCSQAILHFSAFAAIDGEARALARNAFEWTMQNMSAADGSFYYQRHRFWIDRSPYMRWGQAWMFRALAGLVLLGASQEQTLQGVAG